MRADGFSDLDVRGIRPSPFFLHYGMHYLEKLIRVVQFLDILSAGCVLLFCRQNGEAQRSRLFPCRVHFAADLRDKSRNRIARRVAAPGRATPGQFNDGVEQRHVLPSSAARVGPLYFSLRQVVRKPGYAEQRADYRPKSQSNPHGGRDDIRAAVACLRHPRHLLHGGARRQGAADLRRQRLSGHPHDRVCRLRADRHHAHSMV